MVDLLLQGGANQNTKNPVSSLVHKQHILCKELVCECRTGHVSDAYFISPPICIPSIVPVQVLLHILVCNSHRTCFLVCTFGATTCLLLAIERQISLTLRQKKLPLGRSCHSQSLVRKLIFYDTVEALLHQTHAIPSSMKDKGVISFAFLRFACLCASVIEQEEWKSSVLNSE